MTSYEVVFTAYENEPIQQQQVENFAHILALGPIVRVVWTANAETRADAQAFAGALERQINQSYKQIQSRFGSKDLKIWTISNLSLGLIPFHNKDGIAVFGEAMHRLQYNGVWGGGVAFVDEKDMMKQMSVAMVSMRLQGFKSADDIYVTREAALAALAKQNKTLVANRAFWALLEDTERQILEKASSQS